MGVDTSPREYGVELSRFAVPFAVGLLMMGYSAVTYWQSAYMAVHPALGEVHTSGAGVVFHVGVFVIGAIMAFTAFMSSLYKVLQDAGSTS